MDLQTIARGRYFLMLERLIEYFSTHSDVVFESMGDYAARWRTDNPLAQWREQNPDLTGRDAIEL